MICHSIFSLYYKKLYQSLNTASHFFLDSLASAILCATSSFFPVRLFVIDVCSLGLFYWIALCSFVCVLYIKSTCCAHFLHPFIATQPQPNLHLFRLNIQFVYLLLRIFPFNRFKTWNIFYQLTDIFNVDFSSFQTHWIGFLNFLQLCDLLYAIQKNEIVKFVHWNVQMFWQYNRFVR